MRCLMRAPWVVVPALLVACHSDLFCAMGLRDEDDDYAAGCKAAVGAPVVDAWKLGASCPPRGFHDTAEQVIVDESAGSVSWCDGGDEACTVRWTIGFHECSGTAHDALQLAYAACPSETGL